MGFISGGSRPPEPISGVGNFQLKGSEGVGGGAHGAGFWDPFDNDELLGSIDIDAIVAQATSRR